MLNFEALQAIVDDPPTDILELYSRLCTAHSYTYGDVTRIGKVYDNNLTDAPDDVFVQVAKPSSDGDAILATCFIGQTVGNDTEYTSRLGIFLRAAGDSQAILLATTILGKQLGTHIAEAMGYTDYVVVRALQNTIFTIDGDQSAAWMVPLVFPPGISYHTASPGHYIEAGWGQNVTILDHPVFRNPSARMGSPIKVQGNNIRPSAWFYINQAYDGAVLPLNVYITDDQCWATVNDAINVMQQAKIDSLQDHADEVDGSIDTLTIAFAGVADLVGTLSVFGNSVKDVTNKYNAVTQYIPRP